MKKLTGWILIIFCSIFLLGFVIVLISIIPGIVNGNNETQMSVKEILTSSFGFLIMITLLIIGLSSGIRKVKKEKKIALIEYDKELNINLTGKIEYADYRNLILGLSFRKPLYLGVLGIMLLSSLSILWNKEDLMNQADSNYYIFISLGVLLLFPFIILFQIKRIYRTSKLFHQKLNYSLTNDSIRITGETVDSTQRWTHFYQIRETKRFFMFYQGNMVATLLEKKMFSENELQEFSEFIRSLNVKRIA